MHERVIWRDENTKEKVEFDSEEIKKLDVVSPFKENKDGKKLPLRKEFKNF